MKKNIIGLQKFAAKGSIVQRLRGVHFHGAKAVATNSHVLVEVEDITEGAAIREVPITINLEKVNIKNDFTISDDGKVSDENATFTGEVITEDFPEYERLILDNNESQASVCVSAMYLQQIAAFMKGVDPLSRVTINFFGPFKAVQITARGKGQKVTALLMPINK